MTSTPPRRQARLTRATDPRAMRPLAMVEQAESILVLLDRHLWLTHDQIESSLFTSGTTRTGKPRSPRGAAYAANTALRRLYDGGWVERVPVFLPGIRPETVKPHFVNVLTAQGAAIARAALTEQERASRWRRALLPRPWQPLLHDFWIREVAICLHAGAAEGGLRFRSWFDDRQLAGLKKEHGASFQTIPDGFFLIEQAQTGKEFPHFLEIDLGTQTTEARSAKRPDFRGKVESYLTYFERDFRAQFGVATLPIVLTLTSGPKRLANLLAATGAAGGAGRFWFATLAEFQTAGTPLRAREAASAGPHGLLNAAIWRTPAEDQPRSLAARYNPLSASPGASGV